MCGEQKIKFPKDQKGQRSLKGHTHTHMKILMISFVFVFFFAYLLFCFFVRTTGMFSGRPRAASTGTRSKNKTKSWHTKPRRKLATMSSPHFARFFAARQRNRNGRRVCVCVCVVRGRAIGFLILGFSFVFSLQSTRFRTKKNK